jgi:hypothetical protein
MATDTASQTTLRDELTANFDAAEAGTLNDAPVVTPPAEAVEAAPVVEATGDGRPRDGNGRFLPKDAAPAPAQPAAVAPAAAPPAPAEPELRLTTWKKDFLPIQDKLAQGVPLTADESKRLAAYNAQREKEYTTGISAYKSEAQQAKALQEAMGEFMPTLQQHRIEPVTWIRNLGRAHQTLALGTPEQKLQMFARLAKDYSVPIEAIGRHQEGQLDPVIPALMEEIKQLKAGFNTVNSRFEQQDMQAMQKEIARFADTAKFPHFEQVKGDMARLLETGFAQDLDEAYTKAVRLNEEAWSAEQQRQAAASTQQEALRKQAAVQKARNAATGARGSTPVGAQEGAASKDRRSVIAEQLDAVAGGRV